MAEEDRLCPALLLRGDTEYRQASGNSGRDARGVLRDDLLRHRDAGSGGAEGDAQGSQHDGSHHGRRSRRSTVTAWKSCPESFSAWIPTSRKPDTHLLEFIEASQIPLLTINLLQALPKTPLWDRLKRENRLIEDEGRESNVDFRLPYEEVVTTWRACMGSAYRAGQAVAALRISDPRNLSAPDQAAAVARSSRRGRTSSSA